MIKKIKVNEISCKFALVKSNLTGLDYALNPYIGCEHACIYCYAPSVIREKRNWGEFVDIKRNIPNILSKELKKYDKGIVGISTVTDPYQSIEKKYEITRKCLIQLLKYDFPISIQTKSSLIVRDLDIINKFSNKEIGITITTINDDIRKNIEPYSSSIQERLDALKKIKDNNIPTWVFLGPIMPYLTDKENNLIFLIKELVKCDVKLIIIDRLNLKFGLWEKIESCISKNYSDLIPKCKSVLFSKNDYFFKAKKQILFYCNKYGIECKSCF